MAIAGISLYSAFSPADLKDISYQSINYSDSSSLEDFYFQTGLGGLVLGGNNLLGDNILSIPVDIDSSPFTNNSSGYMVNIASLTDSLLIVSWDSLEVVDSAIANLVSLSTDGSSYNTYNFDGLFQNRGHTIGILQLNKYRFYESDKIYVSLPVLQDFLNLRTISKAGWWIIGSNPAAGTESIYSLSFNLEAASKYELGFESGIADTAYDKRRIPNSEFVASDRKSKDTAKTGSYHYSLLGTEKNKSTSVLYLSEAVSTERELPSLHFSLAKNDIETSYHTVLLSVSIPESLTNERIFIFLQGEDLYIPNSMSIPYGKEMSGPLTDKGGDDIFEYDVENGMLHWNLNSGLEQLNSSSNTQFRFLVRDTIWDSNIVATIYDGSRTIIETSNNLPKPKNLLNDAAIYSTYESLNKVKGTLSLFIYSDDTRNNKVTVNLDLENHMSISRNELDRKSCTITENFIISCQLEVENGLGALSLELLHRLDPAISGVGMVYLFPENNDPDGANNVYEIILK